MRNPYYNNYEEEFKKSRAIETFEYKGYTIYSYIEDFGTNIKFTFWYGKEDCEYISSIQSLEEAKVRIDRFPIRFQLPSIPFKGYKYRDGEYGGDFIYGNVDLLGHFDEEFFTKQFLLLNNLDYNTFTVLDKLNIDTSYFDNFKYECPFTKRENYGVVPIVIVSDNIEKYLVDCHQSKKEMVLDMDFQKEYFNEKVPLENLINSITISLMGAGYTNGCYPSNGSKDVMLSTIPLNNGDVIVCVNYVWFNK